MGLVKHLKKLKKSGRHALGKATKAMHKGFTKAGDRFQSSIKADLKRLGKLEEGVSKLGGKVIKKLLPNGKDSLGKFLGKNVRIYAKQAEFAGKVVATLGDIAIVVGTVTGQPEIVAAGVAMDEAGTAVVIGAQTAEEASYALQYSIQGDQKAALIALARAAETGVTGVLNTLTHNTFDNFVAAAIDMSQGDFEGAGRQLGQAALDAVADTMGVPSAQIIAKTDDTQATEEIIEGNGPVVLQPEEHLPEPKKRKRESMTGKGPSGFRSQAYSVRNGAILSKAGLTKPGLAASRNYPAATEVEEKESGDVFESKHNLAGPRANTARGFSGSHKVGQRTAVSGLRAVGNTKKRVKSLGPFSVTPYKDKTSYTVEKMQRLQLPRSDTKIIDKDRTTRVMVLG